MPRSNTKGMTVNPMYHGVDGAAAKRGFTPLGMDESDRVNLTPDENAMLEMENRYMEQPGYLHRMNTHERR